MFLVAFSQNSPAKTLALYLRTNNISCQIVEENQQSKIFLDEPSDYPAAKLITEKFVLDPNHPDFRDIAWQQSAPADLSFGNAFSVTKMVNLCKEVPFTAVILIICLLIHFWVFALGQFQLFDELFFQPLPQLLQNGELWRLQTPTLMHFSTMHLLFNLGWWFMLGRNIETKLGNALLIGIYLLTGVISNYAQFLVSGPNFGGLSGVVYGLLGFCWWMGRLRPSRGISLSNPVIGFMLVWLVIGYADILWINMANTAHTIGLLSGCVLAMAYAYCDRVKGNDN